MNKDVFDHVGQNIQGFGKYLVSHWPLLLLAIFTGSFTYHAAVFYVGTTSYIVMTLTLTEGFLLYWLYLAEGAISSAFEDNKLETNEKFQILASGLGVIVSFAAVVLTDIASAQLIASQSGRFADFTTIPPWTQTIIVNIVWILAVFNVFAIGIYVIASPTAALLRAEARATRIMRKAEIAAQIKKERAAAAAFERRANQEAGQIGEREGSARFDERFKKQPTPIRQYGLDLKQPDPTTGDQNPPSQQ